MDDKISNLSVKDINNYFVQYQGVEGVLIKRVQILVVWESLSLQLRLEVGRNF